ncbi:MAG: Stp1/IreP family PP2C-type Ser/Thr phosphatase [Candidatus Cloacimonetes bacterium]|nr:Stp1/IreP family PP2C-type Ser/Thr phosphatase [Candidatus Cloacimonadota bacterium]
MKPNAVNRFTISNLTDVGMKRESNQDYYGKFSGDFGELLVVCDGMGGYSGGEIASQVAVETIASHFQKLGTDFQENDELHQALNLAQQNIAAHAQQNPDMSEMGTTAVILLIRGERYWIAWIGDSRIYLRRGGQIKLITRDHSWVQEMVDHGIISEVDAHNHPRKNIITRSLSAKPHPADVKGPFPLYRDDVFLLCSDGLTDYLTPRELDGYLVLEPQQACRDLVDEANHRGGKDNITVQILKVNSGKVYKSETPRGSYNLLTLILVFLTVFLGLAATLSLMNTFHIGVFKGKQYVASQSEKIVTPEPDSLLADTLRVPEVKEDKKEEQNALKPEPNNKDNSGDKKDLRGNPKR